jgi:site-specific DNA recombinase
MTWASYARVSSDGQTGLDKYGLERQDRDNDKYIRALGYEGTITQYRDVITGTKETRLEFERLLEDARVHKITRVCIPEVDRLARNVFLSFGLIAELWLTGLEVHNSQKGIIDPKSGRSRREFAQDAIEADAELEKITRRMYAGKLDKVRSGKPARPLDAYGWNKGEIQPDEHAILREMFDSIRSSGLVTIARDLNARGVPGPTGKLWNNTSVRLILTNPVYIGRYEFGRQGERLTLTVPALIDTHDFHAAQAALSRRKTGQGRIGSRLEDFPLTGRFKCAVCGYAMTSATPDARNLYYVCSRGRQVRTEPAARCTHRQHYRTADVHAIVQAELERIAQDPNLIAAAMPDAPAPRDTTAERKRLEMRLTRARASYEAGIDTLEEYAQTKTDVKTRLAGMVSLTPAPPRDPERVRQRVLLALSQNNLAAMVRDANAHLSITASGEITLEVGL